MKDIPSVVGVRPLRMVRTGAGAVLFVALAAVWIACPAGRLREKVERTGLAALLRAFGVRVAQRGTKLPGALYVANHVSWIEIPALALVTGAGFVAKAEVADWPLVGALARGKGCVFVRREARLGAGAQAQELGERLEGRGIVLFPEGTTGPGDALLPFRSSLFAAVHDLAAAPTQPVAVRFTAHDGSALTGAALRRVAWLGEDALLPHALALAWNGGVTIELWFEPPVAGAGRKAIAAACQAAIARRLGPDGVPAQAATQKRAA